VLLVLNVKILHVERVVFDELAAGFDLVAHQDGEQPLGLDSV